MVNEDQFGLEQRLEKERDETAKIQTHTLADGTSTTRRCAAATFL